MEILKRGGLRAARVAMCVLAVASFAGCGGGSGGSSGSGSPSGDVGAPADGGSGSGPGSDGDPGEDGDSGGHDASSAEPSPSFDLSHWRLTLPADIDGGTVGEAADILPAALVGPPPYSSPWFYREADGALTFWVPVGGAIGGSSPNPRAELRELLDPDNARANWSASQRSRLSARCKVVKVPTGDGGVIVGQVHAWQSAHPLVMLRYVYDAATGSGTITAHVNSTPDAATTLKFPLADHVPLNQAFDYALDVSQGVLTMTVDGHSAQYTLGSLWRSAGLYFKAGAYIKAQGSEGGLVSFYKIEATHS